MDVNFTCINAYSQCIYIDICIKLLKIILDYDSRNEYARDEIIFVYKKKYAEHSHLEEYIKKTKQNIYEL